MKKLDSSAFIMTPTAPGSTELREPIRAMTAESEIVVPVGQAVITGLLVMALAVVIAFVPLPWVVFALLFVLVTLILWLLLIVDGRRLLWRIERTFGADLDGDGAQGPPAEPQMFRIELSERTPAGQRTAWLDVPGTTDTFATVCQSALSGLPLSEARWTGTGNPYARSQWAALRDTMLDRGLWEWMNPKARAQGLRLTAAGRHVLRAWLVQWEDARTHAHAPDVPGKVSAGRERGET